MNRKTLTALRGSIKKWEGIVAGTVVDLSDKNCPLCKLFNNDRVFCEGCPVYEKTGHRYCKGTPYREWLRVASDTGSVRTPRTYELSPTRVRAAKDMLKFLKNLLPKQRRAK